MTSSIPSVHQSVQQQQSRTRENQTLSKIVKIALAIISSLCFFLIDPIIGLLATSIITIFTISNIRNMSNPQNTERSPFSLCYWIPFWNASPRNSNASRLSVRTTQTIPVVQTPPQQFSQSRIPVGTAQTTPVIPLQSRFWNFLNRPAQTTPPTVSPPQTRVPAGTAPPERPRVRLPVGTGNTYAQTQPPRVPVGTAPPERPRVRLPVGTGNTYAQTQPPYRVPVGRIG